MTKKYSPEVIQEVESRLVEELRIEENIAAIDSELESLSRHVGRPLTESEQSVILDIVDEFTPKDPLGNYRGATIDYEKAWEIMGLRKAAGVPQSTDMLEPERH